MVLARNFVTSYKNFKAFVTNYTTILVKIHVDTACALIAVVTSFTYKQEKEPPPSPSQCNWLM